MEFVFLSEEVEREARRMGVAFEVGEWKVWHRRSANSVDYAGLSSSGQQVTWEVNGAGTCFSIEVGSWQWGCKVVLNPDMEREGQPWTVWKLRTLHPEHNELMARGLYRLGIENEAIFAELPSLSAHEKMELRLSMPREFWPLKWLGEGAGEY